MGTGQKDLLYPLEASQEKNHRKPRLEQACSSHLVLPHAQAGTVSKVGWALFSQILEISEDGGCCLSIWAACSTAQLLTVSTVKNVHCLSFEQLCIF